MRKWIIYIILILVTFQIVYSLEDCKGVVNPSDIPCVMFGSWIPENNCNTYEAKFYNETPALINTRPLGNYSIVGLCNATMNYTKIGSYFINFTYGDTMRIIVEEDEGMQIAIAIAFSVFAVLFVLLGIFLYLKFKEKE